MTKGLVVILSGASSVGKGDIRDLLLQDKDLKLFYSISETTRPQRPNEVDGKDYYFVTHKEFAESVRNKELLEYIHNNPDDFVVKMAKKSDIIPVLKNANQKDNVDYRKFIDLDEFKGVAKKLEKLSNKFEDYKSLKLENANLDDFLKTVKKLKRSSILKNMGACIGALGILAPVIMIAMRKLDKNNNAFQVKEDLKKELAAKGQI